MYVLGEEVHAMSHAACMKHLELQFVSKSGNERFVLSDSLHQMLIQLGGIEDHSGGPQSDNIRTKKRQCK